MLPGTLFTYLPGDICERSIWFKFVPWKQPSTTPYFYLVWQSTLSLMKLVHLHLLVVYFGSFLSCYVGLSTCPALLMLLFIFFPILFCFLLFQFSSTALTGLFSILPLNFDVSVYQSCQLIIIWTLQPMSVETKNTSNSCHTPPNL